LLGIVVVSCNRPIPFNKEKWMQEGGFNGRHFINDDLLVRGNTRYRMALWLEKNYNFCDKSLDEILDKFYIVPEYFELLGDSLAFERLKNDKELRVIKRRHNPNFIIGIDPWIDINWIEIYFDEYFMVSRVYYVHRNHRTGERTERRICPRSAEVVPPSDILEQALPATKQKQKNDEQE
jgi:hypothetical protein